MSDQQPPKQIYLQAYDSDFYDDNTWCIDRITDEDIEYILQSEYDQLKAENEKLKYVLTEIANSAGIDGCGFTSGEGHANCVWKAREALNEVKE